jgi:hypothetical protein
MDTNNQLSLPVDSRDLGEFIKSLLGRPRLREQHFYPNNLSVSYDWIINLVAIIEQRAAQNTSQLISFQCRYYFQDGRVIVVNSLDDFQAFHDASADLTIGVDLSLSYLVLFPNNHLPERQEVRVEVFSDYRIPDHMVKIAVPKNPLLQYSVSFTNYTWGQDLSAHINNHIDQLMRYDRLTSVYIFADRALRLLGPYLLICSFALFFLAFPFAVNRDEITKHNKIQSEISQLPTVLNMDTVHKKLELHNQKGCTSGHTNRGPAV